MKIIIWFGLVILLLVPLTFADGIITQVNNQTTFYSDFYSQGVLADVSSVVNSLYDENGTAIYTNQPMLWISTGTYAYNYTPNATGRVIRYTTYDYFGNLYQSSEDILIVTNINNIAQDTSDVVQTIFQTFIVFLVGLLIAWLAKYLREPSFYYFSAVYFIGSSAYMVFSGQGWSFPMFFALFGVLIAYKGVSEHIADWEAKQKEKERNTFDEIE